MNENHDRKSDRLTASRARILKAAGEVFLEIGFERTSVDQIAAVARMSKQSIYELFPNKQALFEAAVRDALDMGRSRLAFVEPSTNVEQTLSEFGEGLFRGFADAVNFGLFRASIVAATHFPELADELHEDRIARSRKLADYLETLMDNGTLQQADPLLTASRFGGLAVQGSRYFLGTPLPAEIARQAIVRSAIELFLHGYAGMAEIDDMDLANLTDAPLPPAIESKVAVRLSPEKVQRLMDAVLAEFLEHGFPAAKINRAASAAQSSTATVYRHFSSKENLLRHVVEREIHTTSQVTLQADLAGDAQTALAALARQVLDWHLMPQNIALHRLLIQESDLVPDLAARFYDVRVAVAGRALTSLLETHGLPKPNSAAIRAFYVLATFAARFMTLTTVPEPAQRDSYSGECARLFLRGLAMPPLREDR
ncbi:TetR/AcrR family transcriptional regulator [Novosphingobium sp. KN65.2]|uniref:TetR/AcrR family transcriptional regulator n=1 Tax=Novosphingobium sp. KN65.2 TaxID=1478134 RepID=UPI0005DE82EF|nr:TetR/AcrR family transcriptional regulator [Novosphingobium sp. KN65.2]CDO38410.1 Transcriptional regulator, TetR family [Novosphingobium sp. KN65.2]